MTWVEHKVIARLMLITDRRRSVLPLATLAHAVVAGGCDAIQVRASGAPRSELRATAIEVLQATRGRCAVLVNGDVQLARSLGLGLHLPEHGTAPDHARKALGRDALIGRSVHGPDAAKSTVGADYLIAGNVFATESHPGREGLGLAGLGAVTAAATVPVLAIGGIDLDTAADVIGAGAHGVAVIGALASAPTPREAQRRASDLRGAVDNALATRKGDATMQSDTARVEGSVAVEVNGTATSVPAATTVSAFLAAKGLQDRLVVVELNGHILPRSDYGETIIAEGDRLEVVHFVGGG